MSRRRKSARVDGHKVSIKTEAEVKAVQLEPGQTIEALRNRTMGLHGAARCAIKADDGFLVQEQNDDGQFLDQFTPLCVVTTTENHDED